MSEEQTIEREARLLGLPVRSWRVRYENAGGAGKSFWANARTPAGAFASIVLWAEAMCQPDFVVLAVELES